MRATRWAVSVSVLALGFLSAAEPTLAQQITWHSRSAMSAFGGKADIVRI